jgi:Uma2 family endonuclease
MTAAITPATGAAASRAGAKCPRPFVVGSTGWSADDLEDARIGRRWQHGRHEIVEGVLTTMPAAYRDGTLPLSRLRRIAERHFDQIKLEGEFTNEDDFIVGRKRVARVDLMFMTAEDDRRQQAANAARGKPRLRFGRVLVPPTLIVESLSLGHEEHDRETKRRWYAEARVPNYWLLDAYQRTLECLVLEQDEYRADQLGRGGDEVRPSAFPGLVIPLAELWR